MPKPFSDREQEIIRGKLLQAGRELFGTFGIRKTSIDDLTRHAGIALGSFYRFFDSKEALYFEIVEQEHHAMDQVLGGIMSAGLSTREMLKTLMGIMLEIMETNPVLQKVYDSGEFELLLRKLPPETVMSHMKQDDERSAAMIRELQKNGDLVDERPDVLAALFRSLFFLGLHKEEIGRDVYPAVMERLVDCIATGLTRAPADPDQADEPK